MKKRWIRKIPIVIAIAALAVFVCSEAVMLLWNNILPAVFHVGVITFWQAMGILLLSKLLFGGFKGRRGMHGCGWKKRMFGKWQQMTPEEKELFSARMHQCHGRYAAE
jgi:hypothetical protein